MNYAAKRVPLTCGRQEVDAWAAYMQAHMDEVRQSLAQELVRHEAWYVGEDAEGLYLIGVLDVDDQKASTSIAARSSLSVDAVHRQFKRCWDRSKITELQVPPSHAPSFTSCELLFEARP